MADAVFTTLRSIAIWYHDRDDDYVVPFVKVKRRTPREQHKRARILGDNEIGQVWRTAEHAGQFGAFVKLALLTAQRADKLLTLQSDDIDSAGVWTIRTEAREKGNPGRLVLPAPALGVIRAQPVLAFNPHVFAAAHGDGHAALTKGRLKRVFDRECGITDRWVIHDLRRTARSLMSRAGVQSEIAERVLGHVQGGVQGIYDRHRYTDEMGAALVRLAALVERIVNPPAANVVPMVAS